MAPRTVLHVTDSAELGGAERQIATLVTHLDRDRWAPVLAHHGDAGLAPLVNELQPRASVTSCSRGRPTAWPAPVACPPS